MRNFSCFARSDKKKIHKFQNIICLYEFKLAIIILNWLLFDTLIYPSARNFVMWSIFCWYLTCFPITNLIFCTGLLDCFLTHWFTLQRTIRWCDVFCWYFTCLPSSNLKFCTVKPRLKNWFVKLYLRLFIQINDVIKTAVPHFLKFFVKINLFHDVLKVAQKMKKAE